MRKAMQPLCCTVAYAALQAPTVASNSGPSAVFAGDAAFAVTVNVTFAPGALAQPFSDPGAAARGIVTLRNAADGSAVPGAANVSVSGPGFVTFAFHPSQPLALGPHSVLAAYTSIAAYLLGSTATSAYAFTVVQVGLPGDPLGVHHATVVALIATAGALAALWGQASPVHVQ